MQNQNNSKVGKLSYVSGSFVQVLADKKPFAFLQSLKRQKIKEGVPASKLKITY